MLGELKAELRAQVDPEKAAFFPRFFKSGPGQYGEGDKFLGVTVPKQRLLAKKYKALSLEDVLKLLKSEWHEERLTALLILVGQFKKADDSTRQKIYQSYLANTKYINNWDLVYSSAPHIVGAYLDGRAEKMPTLRKLAGSELLWDRRIAMLATQFYIRQGRADEALEIAEILVHDQHDLIQKAVGWMLREVGEKCGRDVEEIFLDRYAATMPRTALRYALEHFDTLKKQQYMRMKEAS